jgi:hypothetical protein
VDLSSPKTLFQTGSLTHYCNVPHNFAAAVNTDCQRDRLTGMKLLTPKPHSPSSNLHLLPLRIGIQEEVSTLPVLLKRDKEYRKKRLAESLLQRRYHLKDITPRPKNSTGITRVSEVKELELHSYTPELCTEVLLQVHCRRV